MKYLICCFIDKTFVREAVNSSIPYCFQKKRNSC